MGVLVKIDLVFSCVEVTYPVYENCGSRDVFIFTYSLIIWEI